MLHRNNAGECNMDQMTLGEATIHRVEEWSGPFMTPQTLFVGYSDEAYAASKDLVSGVYLDAASDAIVARLQSWIVTIAGQVILIDTGAGNDKERPGIPLFGKLNTPFLERMAAAGFAPEDIDLVICTHLHVDHVGWNTRLESDRWVPTFPNAQYVFPQADAEYWDPRNLARYPDKVGEAVNAGFFDDSVRPILDRGLARLVTGSAEIAPGVRLDPAPGHTPGSQTITVSSRGRSAIFVGDVLHHPLQIMNPGWNSIFCEDGALARRSRRAVLDRVVAEKAILIPAHFAGEHAVRVVATPAGLRPAPV
jgi:glyoxylase-like metal-dependent hydrolase (beta-lactamase superfamily II)